MAANLKLKLILIAVSLSCLFSCSKREITDKEKEMLVVIRDFEVYGVSYGDLENSESFEARTYITGEWEIKYTYDSEDDPDIDSLSIVTRVEFEPTEKEARETFQRSIKAYQVGGRLKGVSSREDPDLFNWGDETYASLLERDGSPVGHVIVVRAGSRIYNLLLFGSYFDQSELLTELLAPKLEKMVSFEEE